MRPLIQYDLDEPPSAPSTSVPPPAGPHPHARQPPTKKRKRNHYTSQRAASGVPKAPVQHWDDLGSGAVGVVYDDIEGDGSFDAGSVEMPHEEGGKYREGDEGADVGAEQEEEEEGEEEEEESRQLTHGEIWDDSALIDAWNSAEAEYEAYHGTSKAWKTEPVKKSPLWYNKPYVAPPPKAGPSKSKSRAPKAQAHATHDEPDTAPLDFDTFVPTHDPSLGGASAPFTAPAAGTAIHATPAPFSVPPPSTTTVSRDEAFNNAMSAMYWSGYWTAVYHSQTNEKNKNDEGLVEATEENGIEADAVEEDHEDLVPTQR